MKKKVKRRSDKLDADSWGLIMQAMPLANDIYCLSRVCKEARRGPGKVDLTYSRRVSLAECLIGRHIIETRDGFLSLSPQETCLIFQVSSTPLKIVAFVPFVGLTLAYDTATVAHLDKLAAWWDLLPFLAGITLDGGCVTHNGRPQVGDNILIIVEIRQCATVRTRPSLRAISTLKCN